MYVGALITRFMGISGHVKVEAQEIWKNIACTCTYMHRNINCRERGSGMEEQNCESVTIFFIIFLMEFLDRECKDQTLT